MRWAILWIPLLQGQKNDMKKINNQVLNDYYRTKSELCIFTAFIQKHEITAFELYRQNKKKNAAMCTLLDRSGGGTELTSDIRTGGFPDNGNSKSSIHRTRCIQQNCWT